MVCPGKFAQSEKNEYLVDVDIFVFAAHVFATGLTRRNQLRVKKEQNPTHHATFGISWRTQWRQCRFFLSTFFPVPSHANATYSHR